MAKKRDPLTGQMLMEGITPVWNARRQMWRYRARYSFTDRQGARRFAGPLFDTAAEAEAFLLERKLELRRGTHTDPTTVTVAAYFDRWYRRKEPGWSGSRARAVRYQWATYFAPAIGGLKLQAVTRPHCQQLVDELTAAGLRGQTVRSYLMVVRSMFEAAVTDGLRPDNPATRLDYPKPTPSERHVWSPLQMRRFLAATRDDELGPLWAFLMATGCRISEALALQWRDVQLDAGTVLIHRTLAYDRAGKHTHRAGTKTASRGRTVALEPWIVARLRALPRRDELVFLRDGKPVNYTTAYQTWRRTVRRVGLPPIRIHDVRHSVASALIGAGVSERIVQDVLGHANIATTLNLYAHVDIRMQRQATTAMSELLGMEAPGGDAGEPRAPERLSR